jgi:hypothetical protein
MAALHATPIGKIGGSALPNSHLPELEYLKSVNRVGPPQDAQLLFGPSKGSDGRRNAD